MSIRSRLRSFVSTGSRPAVDERHYNGPHAANHGGATGARLTRSQAADGARAASAIERANLLTAEYNLAHDEQRQFVAATSLSDTRDAPLPGRRAVALLVVLTVVMEVATGAAFGWALTGGIDSRRDGAAEIAVDVLTIVGFGGLLAALCVVAAEAIGHIAGHLWAWSRGRTLERSPGGRFAAGVTAAVVTLAVLVAVLSWIGNGARAEVLGTESEVIPSVVMSALALALPLALAVVLTVHHAWPAALRIDELDRGRARRLRAAMRARSRATYLGHRFGFRAANDAVVAVALGGANPTLQVRGDELPDAIATPNLADYLAEVVVGGHHLTLTLPPLVDIDTTEMRYLAGEEFHSPRSVSLVA